jgi:hypothetical protein
MKLPESVDVVTFIPYDNYGSKRIAKILILPADDTEILYLFRPQLTFSKHLRCYFRTVFNGSVISEGTANENLLK